MSHPAVHRSIVVVDVEGFGDRRRDSSQQVTVRRGLYRALAGAFGEAGIPWAECDHEDRGDGVFVLVPERIVKARLVDALPRALVAALDKHNAEHGDGARIRLRMAVHAGEVVYDEHGVTASAVNLAFRLLDARAAKTALRESPGVLALIVSEWFFEEVVRHCADAGPSSFRRVRVEVKETAADAWLALPDHPYAADPAQLALPPADRAAGVVPRQLPAAPRTFAGREHELAALTAALGDHAGRGGPVVISALGGAGGIGKTWLALRWAHRYADRFPDGQLFVDLAGFSPSGTPLTPADAVRGFLDALGVAPDRVPAGLAAQVGLYRSLLAGRRLLVVLDNARTTDQVTPLLPGSPTCTVVVTSRDRLAWLVTGHGARPLALDVLTDDEARALLAVRLGADRLAREPDAVAELVARCGGYPLALAIVAGRAEAFPEIPLAASAAELRDAGTRLGALDDGDPAASLPAVLSWSHRALTPAQAELFALLGSAPGPDIGLPAAAALADLTATGARTALRGLADLHLVRQHHPHRWRMHDLVKLYAAEHAGDRRAATTRLLDHYAHTALAGERLLSPHHPAVEPGEPAPGSRPVPLADAAAALDWFAAEHANLLAAQQHAVDHGWDRAAFHLAAALTTFHTRRARFDDQLSVWEKALAAAERLGDTGMRAVAHRCAGDACARLDRHDDAVDHLERALALSRETGDVHGQATAHQVLAVIRGRHDQHEAALRHAELALGHYRELANPVWEAVALNGVGWLHARLGRYAEAREHCVAALDLHRRHGYRGGEAGTLDTLGLVAQLEGRHVDAVDLYREAVDVMREIGNAYFEAEVLERLGHSCAALDRPAEAAAAWRQALELFEAQNRTEEAAAVRERLRG
ncbi:ATP-binding protein [Saccharothrix obliqua]|uniref:ATP-binding protein n=1 Tax=Saccharothrix obliqua TaxID=2861747 RepID=UPI001C5EB4FE|nr:tetratricopeptide repeat protein [Saccharothrix obliqua]MBW4718631.1 tetratricopeptide repeat protein [Saccharothrix obliqua]